MRQSIRNLSLALALIPASSAWAAIPDGYYDNAVGKSGSSLLTALYNIINSHTNVGYDGLYDVYPESDSRSDGTLWDMYSTKHWTWGNKQCGSYKNIGDCYNREHSVPQSWFNEASPMKADAFHVYPTDGKVNGQRSNYPYGECENGTSLGTYNGVTALGRLGSCTFSGYTGTVFEPDDEYKGDFARTYFYMATCYNNKISSWSGGVFGNGTYPGMATWCVNLFLKWHREDPVSQKELDRNEAVYKYQKNRNPYIDYPELAEHVWGTKTSTAWTGDATEQITYPADQASINLGITGVNLTLSKTITVTGNNLTSPVTVAVSGTGFSVSSTSLAASSVTGSGASLTISYLSSVAATATGTLTLTSGDACNTVTLSAQAMDGIPVGNPTNITSESFTANWVALGDATTYSISVWRDGTLLTGYPKSVTATDQAYTVTGLEPETTYTYQISSTTLQSVVKTVTTGALIPSIQFMYDGDLTNDLYQETPGTPGNSCEILLDIENVSGDITISCGAPFQVSTDKSTWGTSTTVAEEADRFYLRMNSSEAGTYTTDLYATAGSYSTDIDITTSCGTAVTWCETFDNTDDNTVSDFSSYTTDKDFTGVMCSWHFKNAGLWTTSGEAYSGTISPRFNKDGLAVEVYMTEDKTGGVGKVSFYAKKWNNSSEIASTVEVYHSANQGSTWTKYGTVTVESTEWTLFEVTVNQGGAGRVKFVRPSTSSSSVAPHAGSSRMNLDDVTITNYTHTSVESLAYHSWDAYCRDHRLVIENGDAQNRFLVYGVDGIVRYDGAAPSAPLELAPGLYIVACNDFARRVLVR